MNKSKPVKWGQKHWFGTGRWVCRSKMICKTFARILPLTAMVRPSGLSTAASALRGLRLLIRPVAVSTMAVEPVPSGFGSRTQIALSETMVVDLMLMLLAAMPSEGRLKTWRTFTGGAAAAIAPGDECGERANQKLGKSPPIH